MRRTREEALQSRDLVLKAVKAARAAEVLARAGARVVAEARAVRVARGVLVEVGARAVAVTRGRMRTKEVEVRRVRKWCWRNMMEKTRMNKIEFCVNL